MPNIFFCKFVFLPEGGWPYWPVDVPNLEDGAVYWAELLPEPRAAGR